MTRKTNPNDFGFSNASTNLGSVFGGSMIGNKENDRSLGSSFNSFSTKPNNDRGTSSFFSSSLNSNVKYGDYSEKNKERDTSKYKNKLNNRFLYEL